MDENQAPQHLNLSIESGSSATRSFSFQGRFEIGRHPECQVCLKDNVVSRRHAEVFREKGQWWIRDLGSANGVFLDGRRVSVAALGMAGHFQLGSAGPMLAYRVEAQGQPEAIGLAEAEADRDGRNSRQSPDLDHYKSHYFGAGDGEKAGEHTMMVRRAYAEVRKKQRLTYLTILGFVLVLLVITGAVALHKHRQVVQQRRLAADVFYTMRALELDLIKLKAEAQQRRSLEAKIQIDAAESQKEKLEQSYGRYVESLGVYGKGMSAEEKIILRMAHRFGECEINMPGEFAREVRGYIKRWQSSGRFFNVLQRAERLGYVSTIVRDLAQEQLPPQFLYLALQESNLNSRAVGPVTRFGIAKGMWQFIPSTAEKYGLRVGPLKDVAEVDLLDERQDVAKSTRAAARYLKDIYTTDAQASGLLVMASYNWGEERVIQLIQSMPKNPRERNFWQLIAKYRDKIPDETYDYVFSIFSAAVIGENPRLFGFDMDNPLALKNR